MLSITYETIALMNLQVLIWMPHCLINIIQKT